MTVFGGRHLTFFLLLLSTTVAQDQWVLDLMKKSEVILATWADLSLFIDTQVTDPNQLQDPNVINVIVAALLDEFLPISVKLPTADTFSNLEDLVEGAINETDITRVELTAEACGADTLKVLAEADLNTKVFWGLVPVKGNIKVWICFKVSYTNRVINFQVISQDADFKGKNLAGRVGDFFINEGWWIRKVVKSTKKDISQLTEGVEEALKQYILKDVDNKYKKVVDEFVDRLFSSKVELLTDANYIEFKLSL